MRRGGKEELKLSWVGITIFLGLLDNVQSSLSLVEDVIEHLEMDLVLLRGVFEGGIDPNGQRLTRRQRELLEMIEQVAREGGAQ
jgi:hypothetical protein